MKVYTNTGVMKRVWRTMRDITNAVKFDAKGSLKVDIRSLCDVLLMSDNLNEFLAAVTCRDDVDWDARQPGENLEVIRDFFTAMLPEFERVTSLISETGRAVRLEMPTHGGTSATS